MMRYSITGTTPNEVSAVGGKNIIHKPRVGVIFADLELEQAAALKSQGYVVAKVGKVRPGVIAPPPEVSAAAIYTLEDVLSAIRVDDIRECADPPLFGQGQVVAVVDTGIREDHVMLSGRVVYSKNFTSGPMLDEYDHGTGVASAIIATAPLCSILNLKVLDKTGIGTAEEVIGAVEECLMLRDINSPFAPNVMNISVGSEDSGDPTDILRVACRAAIADGMIIVAAGGNSGPEVNSVMAPAVETLVVAVGSVSINPFIVSDFSSRGPSDEGVIKPDTVMAGQNIVVASSESSDTIAAKSGTSFSAPIVSGVALLLSELGQRATGNGDIDSTAFHTFLSGACVKPEGAPVAKDDDYGYGVLYGSSVQDTLGVEVFDLSTMLSGVLAIGMIGIVAKMGVSSNGQ